MQGTKVPWPTQCKSALSVLVTGTLNMGSSCFGDGVHFEQILSRRAELCVSVWSIVCRHCQNQGAGMQDTKVPWPTQCKSALSVLVTGTLNMGSSCFGDGVHFEQILSRKAELCVSVWSIVCRHCQNQGAGMQDTKVPWPTQCKSALSVFVTGTLNHGVILFRRWGALGEDFEQKSRTLCFCMVHSLQALSKSGCWDARHESSLTNPVQKRFVRLSHRNLEHGVILFRRWGALWADFEQKSRTLCFCMVHSLQALSKSGCWDARHESSLTNPVQKRFVRLSHRNLEHGVILFRRWGALWADFEQKSRTLCFCMVHSLQALSKSGCWDARHESSLTNPVQKRFVRLSHRNLESWGHPGSAVGCGLHL